MNNRSLLLALALPSMIGADGYATDPGAVDDPMTIGIGDIELQATALDNGVRLQWVQSRPYGDQISYCIRWEPTDAETIAPDAAGVRFIHWLDGTEATSFFGTTAMIFTADIGPLHGRLYTFYVNVMRRGQAESVAGAVIEAAPARHYDQDASRPGEILRLYEQHSNRGSGLVLDPERGGPTIVIPAVASPGSVQLVLTIDEAWGTDSFRIGTAYGSPEESGHAVCDPDVFIQSDLSEPHDQSLNNWYLPHRAFSACDFNCSNLGSVTIPRHIAPGVGGGEGFIICLGVDIDRRFVRVRAIAREDGAILRGEAPDRHVELEISLGYPGVPWA